MAEAVHKTEAKNCNDEKEENVLECAVCLQRCIHPAQLPCGHIFCFLCIKGFANQYKKCAMCRHEIPRDFIEHPNLLEDIPADDTLEFDEGYQWFYEGRNGWWKYDARASEELEEAHKLGVTVFEMMICGETYIVDLTNQFQCPKSHQNKKRSIKRDKRGTIVVKGVAGLR